MITAPYNFVPLNDKVFHPDWADRVSYDIPFEDGESGEIEVTIISQSPIFIRDGKKRDNDPSEEFCHAIDSNGAKKFYIPGSSAKGMVRNVLEIISFGKIVIDENKYSDVFGVRDMTNRKELVGQANGCGFLVKMGDNYIVEDCGKPLTISFKEVKNATGKWLKDCESAKQKYNLLEKTLQEIPIRKEKRMMHVRGKNIPKPVAVYQKDSPLRGVLVVTGQINNKKNEFIFIKNGKLIENIDNKVIQGFKSVYLDNEDSVDGQFWKNKNKIPVFYKKDGEKIVAIGLTQLFKLPYRKSIVDAAKQNGNNAPDLAQTIFGYVDDKKQNKALKGRVQFGHFLSSVERYESQIKEEVLGEPKPTYYPNYIEQKGNDGRVKRYITLMDKEARIRGWKRYPLRREVTSNLPSNDNDKISTKFKPLDKGTIFSGKIRFHNLKKVEIGALVSALTFHGKEDQYYHNIGMAKSLGYGKIEIKIDKLNARYTKDEYLQEFEKLMNAFNRDWINSKQLKELFSMANKDIDNDQKLVYQKLENPKPKYYFNNKPEANDFVGAKKSNEYLKPYIAQVVARTAPAQSHKQSSQQAAIPSSARIANSSKPPVNNVAVYSMADIASEVGTSVEEVLAFANTSTLPIPKNLTKGSELKEAQAKGLIKKMKKERGKR